MFPVMDADMVDEFEELASAEEKAELDEWYGVREVINRQDHKKHILSVSLFWKPMQASADDYPEPTVERLKHAKELGIATRFNPWGHYVEPLIEGVPKLTAQFDDLVVRVHLAKDLEFLIPDLVEAGCEIWLMRHESIRFAPGGLWRLLPFAEKDRLITMADTDRMVEMAADIERTRAMAKSGLGAWRNVVPLDTADDGGMHYRPFIGSQMGVQGGWPMKQLLMAFTWQVRRGAIVPMGEQPGCGLRPMPWASWPNHFFDEWFLAVAFYPRVAGAGLLTFAPATVKSAIFAMDVEYATWSNPESQLVFFPVESCCKPVRKDDEKAGEEERLVSTGAGVGSSDAGFVGNGTTE